MGLNISTVKRFITETCKISGAHINTGIVTENEVNMTYEKGNILLPMTIKAGPNSKYKYIVDFPSLNINNCMVHNLNEVKQAMALIIEPCILSGQQIISQAKIKANHWDMRFVTVERQDGYRANLYISGLLFELLRLRFITINGLKLTANDKGIRCNYDKGVLNYEEIQRAQDWGKYDKGFVSVNDMRKEDITCREGYIHPSTAWQIGRIF